MLVSSSKDVLRRRFSTEPDKYYRVKLFDELGFFRKECPDCHGFFWTMDQNRITCPEPPCQKYEFLGNPPTSKRFNYLEAWRQVESFFRNNGHNSLARYPVVCRWRPDLYFTVASIVDFQRIESGKVIFEFPFNPIIIPQMCLRFLDIANVGITGRHYTSFCMVGQQALANSEGYWKDRCIELDFKLLTQEFGIPKEEIVFKEDVWLGPGAFGNSLEYYVRGLELGNAVFTSFEGTPDDFVEYNEKVVDMGAGLERWVWIANGTSNSYDAVFPEVMRKLKDSVGVELPSAGFLNPYYKLAGTIDAEEFQGGIDAVAGKFSRELGVKEKKLRRDAKALQALYSVADHARTLAFAISDGALPSNVGGGYNLRVVLRRALEFASQIGMNISLSEVALWHVGFLSEMYPELKEHEEDIKIILDVEAEKYRNAISRSSKIVESLGRKSEKLTEEKLAQLYDSEGITPETLAAAGFIRSVPSDFYTKITEMHMAQKKEESAKETFDIEGLPPTELLFYINRDQFEFEAKVLRVIGHRYVVLDRTCFYARAGGQEPDRGAINGVEVIDVIKSRDIVLHQVTKLSGEVREGATVKGVVDSHRRSLIMRHHTATHIVNGATRKLIGPWVWQHSAFKDIDMGRLDITHFAHLNKEQVMQIERTSNEAVRRNLPVRIQWIPRTNAEQEYGFRLYQGGAAPTKELRVVNIEGWDVEACGGTHCTSTGEVGLIKITKSERVQDGIERIEFVAGEAAVNYVENQESILAESAAKLETTTEKLSSTVSNLKKDLETSRKSSRQLATRLSNVLANEIPERSKVLPNGIRLFESSGLEDMDSEFHLSLGEKVTRIEPLMVYVAIFTENDHTKIMVFSGRNASELGANAGSIAREIANALGGSGGGDKRFGQGGLNRVEAGSSISVESMVRKMIL